MAKTNNKKNKGWFITLSILIGLFLLDNIYLIINIIGLYSIENTLRLVAGIIITLLSILGVFLGIKTLIKKKKTLYIIFTVISLIYIGIIGFVNVNFNIIYSKLNKVSASYTTYSISLVTQADNNVNSITNIGNNEIGIINDKEIANGYTFGEEIIKTKKMSNTLKEYESYTEILNDLLDGKITYAFLPSNYVESFSTIEGYEKIGTKLKTIYEQSKQEQQLSSSKDVTEPFTVLLMGVDSTNDNIANTTANGDSLMLVTFNPKTLTATMVSIPRDSYVPISCMQNKKNKITHSSWGGETCIIKTIENFTGVDIDYYAKINFTGIVKLVDSLGGIDIDIEYSFCEQNSKRQWGENTVYVEKGFQTINGEQALAYSRNRHPNPGMCSSKWTNYDSNDFIRGQHQQDVVKAILSKLKDVRELDTFYSLLDTISNNMETNMDSNTILSFYNVAKDIVIKSKNATKVDDLINIQKLYISGYSAMIYDYSQKTNSGMKMVLYNFVPYKGSITDVANAMKVNLGIKDNEIIKTFSFDINNPYEEKIIGQGSYNESTIPLLPDFTGKTKSYVESYAAAHGLKVTYTTIENDGKYTAGTVISQDPPARMDLDNISSTKGITIKIAGSSTPTVFDYTKCIQDEYKDNSHCLTPSFNNTTYKYFNNTWVAKYGNNVFGSNGLNIKFSPVIIKNTDTDYDKTKEGYIKSITVDGNELKTGTSLYSLKNKTITITYYGEAPKEETTLPGTSGETEEGTDNTRNS